MAQISMPQSISPQLLSLKRGLWLTAVVLVAAAAWKATTGQNVAVVLAPKLGATGDVFSRLSVLVTLYFLCANASYLVILAAGLVNARRYYGEAKLGVTGRMASMRTLTPISVLVPAYNEEKSIVASVEALLRLDYPDFEVVVCSDGSKDRTLAELHKRFELFPAVSLPPQLLPSEKIKGVFLSHLYPTLIVVDKANGGKADALNAALNFARHPLICCVDADSIIDAGGLARIALPFFEDYENTLASGGTISVLKIEDQGEGAGLIARWLNWIQVVEYIRAFLVGRMGWDYLGCTTIISGAFGLFKKSAVLKVGGYLRGSIGEDMELLLRLRQYDLASGGQGRVRFLPDPVCWTEAPSDLTTLGKQRSRWMQGLLDSLWRSRSLFFRRGSGLIGWVALPYIVLFEAISAPIEILGHSALVIALLRGSLEPTQALALVAVTMVFGVFLNLGAVLIDQSTFRRYATTSDLTRLMFGAIFEQFGFRFLHLYWRQRGAYRFLRGRHDWGVMVRRGFGPKP